MHFQKKNDCENNMTYVSMMSSYVVAVQTELMSSYVGFPSELKI